MPMGGSKGRESGILAPRDSGTKGRVRQQLYGSVAERFKAPVLKTGDRETYP